MVYKNIKTFDKAYLKVNGGHEIYYEQSGNRNGTCVLFVHGGPGGGCSESDKRFFNPKIFRIVTFDQRGSGKSRPFASLKNNTTFHLTSDMRQLLRHLGIDKTFLFGGSWGSTLSLCYGIAYPETVLGMVVRGIFLPSKEDNDYFIYHAKNVFPEAWEKMAELVPEEYHNRIMQYYFEKMNSNDHKTRKKYALAWATYEFSISKIIYSEKKVKKILSEVKYEAFSTIELHYLLRNCFLPRDYIIKNASKIKCPVTIVHGRYDHVCPPSSAYSLHKSLHNSRLYFTFGGHSASDTETEKVLVREMDRIGRKK